MVMRASFYVNIPSAVNTTGSESFSMLKLICAPLASCENIVMAVCAGLEDSGAVADANDREQT